MLNNDGIHAPLAVKASVKLTKGPTPSAFALLPGPGTGIALMLTWKRPEDTEWGYIARRIISRPDAPAKPAEVGQPASSPQCRDAPRAWHPALLLPSRKPCRAESPACRRFKAEGLIESAPRSP